MHVGGGSSGSRWETYADKEHTCKGIVAGTLALSEAWIEDCVCHSGQLASEHLPWDGVCRNAVVGIFGQRDGDGALLAIDVYLTTE
eukprot:5041394-Pyramimonas_sp.AAC.1